MDKQRGAWGEGHKAKRWKPEAVGDRETRSKEKLKAQS